MFISPMLLEQSDKPFSDFRYLFEPKIDGHRLILSRVDGETRLYTRHNNDVTAKYPELVTEIVTVVGDADVILDGELAVLDPDTGIPNFELTMARFHGRKLPIAYIVFDILSFKGEELRDLSLIERKAILDRAVTDTETISKIVYIDGRGEDLYEVIVARNMEGIVAKRKNGRYHAGKRTDDFVKVINYTYADVYLTGWRKSEFGWLAHIPNECDKLRPAGVIELGVPPEYKKAFYSVAESLVTGEDREYVYVEPRLQARVKFRNWTESGLLRSPVFINFVLVEKVG